MTAAASLDLTPFCDALPGFIDTPGPQMTVLEIVPGAPYPRNYACIHGAETRQRFREALTPR